MQCNNNYNTSNTGINIEFNICKDTFLSQINFDENIVRSENFDKYFIYRDYGNLDHHFKYDVAKIELDDLFKIEEDQANKIKFMKFMSNELNYCYLDMKDHSILDILNDHLYYSDLNDVMNIISCSGVDHAQLFDTISVTGYCQGDYAEVIILTEALQEVWGIDQINLDDLKKEISHYFYDSPISARLTINDQEFISDKYDGIYEEWNELEYNKDDLIDEVLNEFNTLNQDTLRSELEAIIPASLEYIA